MGQNQALWDRAKIVFVTGKGGVGKSLVAAGIAAQQAQRGRRVLLAEIGENSYYKDFWQLSEVTHRPLRLSKHGFDLALWNSESCLREYVLHFLKMERFYRLFFENRVMRALINVAPGLSEIAILGKITSGIRRVGPEMSYDLIVVDAYATGHVMALLQAPKGMMEAIEFGPMGSNSREILSILKDSEITRYALVTLLEELPVIETLEFQQKLTAEIGVQADIVVNKRLTLPLSVEELEVLRQQYSTEKEQASLREFCEYLLATRQRQEQMLANLNVNWDHRAEIPLVFSADVDRLVTEVKEALRKA